MQVCQDYKLTGEELRTAAIVELLTTDKLTKADGLEPLVTKLNSVLTDSEMMSAVRWAQWIKHAKKLKLPGVTATELLDIRKVA